MQHPDESTIHSWLDDALKPDEAAGLEAHVAGCVECQAKVAEARGFISASSRILSSLDDVQGNVIPVAPEHSPFNWTLLRAAALLAVVAGGGILVFRTRSTDADIRTATNVSPVISDTVRRESASVAPVAPDVRASKMADASTQSRRRAVKVGTMDSQSVTLDEAPAVSVQMKAIPADLAQAAPTANTMADVARTRFRAEPQRTLGGLGMAADGPLKVLRTERTQQGNLTFYEVTSNRIAVLNERDTAPDRSVLAKTSQPAIAAGSASQISAASSTPMFRSATINTIEWIDESDGKTLELSGPFSIAELVELKQRIVAMRSSH